MLSISFSSNRDLEIMFNKTESRAVIFAIGQKNNNLVEDDDQLLPVSFVKFLSALAETKPYMYQLERQHMYQIDYGLVCLFPNSKNRYRYCNVYTM